MGNFAIYTGKCVLHVPPHPLKYISYQGSNYTFLRAPISRPFLTLTLSWFGGEGGKNCLPKEGGWRKKARAARLPGPGLEPGTCRTLGEGPGLHARGLFRQASLSVPIDRVGRLRNTMCCMFWR